MSRSIQQLCLIVSLCFEAWLAVQLWPSFRARYIDIPKIDRLDLALEYFGHDWQEAIRECDEAHLAGDCVLCGQL